MGIIVAQAESDRQMVSQVNVRLVEDTQVELWCMEQAGNIHSHINVDAATGINSCHSLLLGHASAHHALQHSTLNLHLKHLGEVGTELVGSRCLQPLVAAEDTRCPVPAATVVVLERKLLSQRIAQLILVHRDEVHIAVVVIHQQVILQQLVAGVRCEVKTVGLILDSQTCGQHVTLVFALVVLVRISLHLATLNIKHAVRISLLTHILIVRHPVERQTVCGLIYQSQTSASLVHVIGTLARQRILPEAVRSVVEGSYRQGQFVTQLCIVGHLCLTIEVGANAQLNVCTLIVHWVLGVLTNQSALGINTVKRTLRATQHIDTVQLINMAVECRLVHQGDIVNIDTHRGTVDA